MYVCILFSRFETLEKDCRPWRRVKNKKDSVSLTLFMVLCRHFIVQFSLQKVKSFDNWYPIALL